MGRPAAIELLEPSLETLAGYVTALRTGWSPSTTRDVSTEQLAVINEDAAAFVNDLTRHEGGTVKLRDGTSVPRLPGRVLWIWDGDFCGAINLRFVPGTLELPPHVSGHIGYAVVPWKRRLGYATRALALMLPVAHALGLAKALVTCDPDNLPSRRVIEANAGVAAGDAMFPDQPGERKLLFWIDTTTRA